MHFRQERQTAVQVVTQAARLCINVREEMVGVAAIEKRDSSPVTVADFGSQALVCRGIRHAFPQDAIVAEETSGQLRQAENVESLGQVTHYVQRFEPEATPEQIIEWIDAGNGTVSDRYWTLDPIDGTKGFLRNDQYAIALALVLEGQVQVGALACPALPLSLEDPGSPVGAVFIAVRGQGAAVAPMFGGAFTPTHVSHPDDGVGLRLVESVESAHGNHALQEAIAESVGITRPALKMDSQAKYAAVARGDAALYLRLPASPKSEYREKIWDHAAGALIVEEAGGKVTDLFGQHLDFGSGYRMCENRGVVVSNGTMHARVLEALGASGYYT
jgi:3'(2'), 5'-bisphosphate nucleotidase